MLKKYFKQTNPLGHYILIYSMLPNFATDCPEALMLDPRCHQQHVQMLLKVHYELL